MLGTGREGVRNRTGVKGIIALSGIFFFPNQMFSIELLLYLTPSLFFFLHRKFTKSQIEKKIEWQHNEE